MSRIDAFVAASMKQVELPPEQREAVETELRRQLSKAAKYGVKHNGLHPEDAETEAVRVLGQWLVLPAASSRAPRLRMLLGHFAVVGIICLCAVVGTLWMAADVPPFILLAQAGLLILFWLVLLPFMPSAPQLAPNGDLVITRLLGKQIRIPLKDVRAVHYSDLWDADWARILGVYRMSNRYLELVTAKGRHRLAYTGGGLTMIAALLYTVADDLSWHEIDRYFESFYHRMRRERMSNRILLTVGWAVVAGLLLWDFRSTWTWFSPPLLAIPAAVLTVPLSLLQAHFHAQRWRRRLTFVLFLPLLALPWFIFVGWYYGHILLLRWGLILLAVMPSVGLVLLWWRARDRGPFHAASVLLLAGAFSLPFVTIDFPSDTLVMSQGPFLTFAWSRDGDGLLIERGKDHRVYLARVSPDVTRAKVPIVDDPSHSVPRAREDIRHLRILSEHPDGWLLLHERYGSSTLQHVCRMDPASGLVRRIAAAAPLEPLSASDSDEAPLWSSDGRRLLRWQPHMYAKEAVLGWHDVVTGATGVIVSITQSAYAAWEAAGTVRFVYSANPRGVIYGGGSLTLYRAAVDEATREAIANHVFSATEDAIILPGLEYALVHENVRRTAGITFSTRSYLLHLTSGAKTLLGPLERGGGPWRTIAWHPQHHRLVFLNVTGNGALRRLVAAAPDSGKITSLLLPADPPVQLLLLSPDGNRVAVFRSFNTARMRASGWGARLDVWDIGTQDLRPVCLYREWFGHPLWSPDSQSLAVLVASDYDPWTSVLKRVYLPRPTPAAQEPPQDANPLP